MEKRKKWLVILLISLLIVSAIVTYALILVKQRFDTTGVLSVPTELDVNMTEWDWGEFNLTGETVNSSQGVSFRNLGAIPLELSAIPDTAIPEWFNGEYWSISWTGEGYVLYPLETIDTTFILMVSVKPTKDYMITHQIQNLTFTLGIDVTGSKVFKYFLTITTSNIGGTTDPISGTYTYDAGTDVVIQSVPDSDYELIAWVINGEVFDPTVAITICMNQSYTVEAQFYPIGPAYNLIISAEEGGTTEPTPDVYAYPEGKVVTVTAIPDSGYEFDYWTLSLADYTINPISVTMDADHSLTAYFKEVELPNTMWIEPSSVNITGLSIGDKFNVTVWINLTESCGAWQFRLLYDKSFLNATRCGYTAGSKSDFFKDIITLPVEPVFDVENDTHDYVTHGESWMMGDPRGSGYGSLSWIEFEIMAVPLEGEIVTTLDISTYHHPPNSKTFALDFDTMEEIPLKVYDCICTIKPAGPAH